MNNENYGRMPEEWQQKRERKREARRRRVLIYKGLIGLFMLPLVVGGYFIFAGRGDGEDDRTEGVLTETTVETTAEYTESAVIATPSSAEAPEQQTEEEEETPPETAGEADVLEGYETPGIANVSDYLNIRDHAEADASIIGRLPAGGICEILEEGEIWYRIRYGEVEGYINGSYLLTGEAAAERAVSGSSDLLPAAVDSEEQ